MSVSGRCGTTGGAIAENPRSSILVLDPDDCSRELLRTTLERLGADVRTVVSAAAARATLEEPLDLVVLEVDLPDGSGYELCRELHDVHGEELPIIFVSEAHTEPGDRVAGLLLGGDDYLAKPFDPDELLARVRRSLRRSGRPAQRRDDEPAPSRGLTPREHDVLSLLADGLSQKEIAAELVISPKTVGTHIQHILEKLDAHSRAQAVAVALREGLAGPEVSAHGAHDADASA